MIYPLEGRSKIEDEIIEEVHDTAEAGDVNDDPEVNDLPDVHEAPNVQDVRNDHSNRVTNSSKEKRNAAVVALSKIREMRP